MIHFKIVSAVLFLGLGFAIQSSQACLPQVGEKYVTLSCHEAQPIFDAGIIVVLEETYVGHGQANELNLIISEQTIAGPRLLETVRVKKEDLDGSPIRYTGSELELSVNWTPTPTQGGHLSSLSGVLNGAEVDWQLACQFIVRPTYRCR
jgi:hypothetical protein